MILYSSVPRFHIFSSTGNSVLFLQDCGQRDTSLWFSRAVPSIFHMLIGPLGIIWYKVCACYVVLSFFVDS